MKAAFWALPLSAALVLAACAGDDDDDPIESTATPSQVAATSTVADATQTGPTETPTEPSNEFFDFESSTTTPSGLSFIDIQEGTGGQPRPDQIVAVHYTGLLASTGEVFDTSIGGEPVSFPLTRVIPGFAEGIRSMKEGGIRRMYLPTDLAYANAPPPGSGIPLGAELIFEVELVSVK